MERMGEDKHLPLRRSVKCQKAPLGRRVSTNFVADCSQKRHIKVMKNLKFGVNRANIKQDTAIYKPDNL